MKIISYDIGVEATYMSSETLEELLNKVHNKATYNPYGNEVKVTKGYVSGIHYVTINDKRFIHTVIRDIETLINIGGKKEEVGNLENFVNL